MKTIYIIQDANKEATAATFELSEATKLVSGMVGYTYREIPFIMSEGTTMELIAGPIPKQYCKGNKI